MTAVRRADEKPVRRLTVLIPVLALAFALPAGTASAVMNGASASQGEFPWAVALVFADTPPVQGQFCGGSLVAPDVVVTAAHCTMGSRADEIEVFAGKADLTDVDPGDVHTIDTIHLPANAVVDPDDDGVPRRDIALLRLSQPVAGAAPIAPVAPAPAPPTAWAVGDPLEVMGWGLTESGFPDLLQHVEIDRVSDSTCAGIPGYGFVAEDMLCALRVAGQNVYDSCSGDSGGPLTTSTPGADPTDPADFKLVGAVSYGSPSCDDPDLPGVYARLGAPDLNAFVEEFRDGDETDDPGAQIEQTGGSPILTGTMRVGEQITCDPSNTTWSVAEPVSEERRVRWLSQGGPGPFDDELITLAVDTPYTVKEADVDELFLCEVHARKSGVGGYGVARSGLFEGQPRVSAPSPTPSPTPAPAPPPPPPPAPVAPPPPDPQPFVPEPRDEQLPITTSVRRRCASRRCSFTVRATDDGPGAGVATVQARLTTTFRCRRAGRRRLCTRTRTLTVTRVAPGLFRLHSVRLRRGALHILRVRAVDLAGNREARSRVLSFRLRRAGR